MAGYEKHDGTDQVEGSERAVTTRETAADAVISGGKDDHQGRYLDAKATENQDSLSDMQLKALSPTDASRAELASDRFEIVDSVEPEAGTADGRQLAIRDDYCNRFEFQGKPLPGDGQTLSFKQILEDYQTPFVDAYERSRQTKDRQPGKSKTLEQVVDRLKACPWADEIKILFSSKALNPEYDPRTSTITINPADSPVQQIQTFAHEAFHSTHQFLGSQFLQGRHLSESEFVDLFLEGEVDSFLVEMKVRKEVGVRGSSVEFALYDPSSDSGRRRVDLEDLFRKGGREKLKSFLSTATPAEAGQMPYEAMYRNFSQDI